MNPLYLAAASMAAACLIGCASTETRLSTPLGPRPGSQVNAGNSGALQVFTAQQRVVNDVKFEEFFAGEESLKLFDELAHTDYTLCTQEGKVLQRVKNSRNSFDPEPTQLSLPPGRYHVEAEYEGTNGARLTVVFPVVIEAGFTTRVHLQPQWMPNSSIAKSEVVRLPNGQPVGWRATLSQFAHP